MKFSNVLSLARPSLSVQLPTGLLATLPDLPVTAGPCALHRGRHRRGGLPRVSGPFEILSNVHRVLVPLDVENLHYSARDLRGRVDFAALAALIRAANPASELHAVLSVAAATAEDTCDQAAAAGWIGHMRPIITAGLQRGANADTTLAFVAGYTMARSQPETVVIGTGDGARGLDIARKIREAEPRCRTIATLSFAHSTSHLLGGAEIDVNLHLGADVLHLV